MLLSIFVIGWWFGQAALSERKRDFYRDAQLCRVQTRTVSLSLSLPIVVLMMIIVKRRKNRKSLSSLLLFVKNTRCNYTRWIERVELAPRKRYLSRLFKLIFLLKLWQSHRTKSGKGGVKLTDYTAATERNKVAAKLETWIHTHTTHTKMQAETLLAKWQGVAIGAHANASRLTYSLHNDFNSNSKMRNDCVFFNVIRERRRVAIILYRVNFVEMLPFETATAESMREWA